jgi:hypothetical protein
MMNKPRIVAVMPVSGREELFGITIDRLFQQEDVEMTVVCIGHTETEESVAEDEGAIALIVSSALTLGEKWQLGIDYAKWIEPDAVMIVGSGNWFTNGWCKTLYPYLDEYDVVGSEAMYALHFREKDRILIHWGGYYTQRKGDMLGAGRMLSRRILDRANWQIYDTSLNMDLDKSMTGILKGYDAKFLTLPQGDEMILKISSYKWKSINSFLALWMSPTAKQVDDPDKILKHFPEALTLFND